MDRTFTNEPEVIVASVPIWIRPDEVVLTLTSYDMSMYGCDANYTLQTGGQGRFYVDASSGEVRIANRAEFFIGDNYTLGVSAECAGAYAAYNEMTHSQRVTIFVDDVDPQFFYEPYIIGVPETSSNGVYVTAVVVYTQLVRSIIFKGCFAPCRVDQVKVMSFQGLSMVYDVEWEDPDVDTTFFSINPNNGDVTLLQSVTYITAEKVQFRCNVTATEDLSGYSTRREVHATLLFLLKYYGWELSLK